MENLIHLDTMHLVVKYPYADVFQKWYRYADGLDHRKLKEGVPVGDFVVRGGASCYKVSLWQHDARIFLTDQVDEKLGDGKGSGIWIQLGPKFLIHHANELRKAIQELLNSIGVNGSHAIKITRLDLAMDLLGVDMKEQDLTLWQEGWVGRSKISALYFNSRTGVLETINIGSRQSAVFLRVYDKVAQAISEGDFLYWQDIWGNHNGPVTRIEWEVKPSEGNFSDDLKDFDLFIGFSVIELLIYLLDWGRLCIPDSDDSNNRRWKDAPLWEKARELARSWCEGVNWPTSRYGKEFKGMSEAYINFVSGTISGSMARFAQDNPNMVSLINGLKEHGHSLDEIQQKAKEKAAINSRL